MSYASPPLFSRVAWPACAARSGVVSSEARVPHASNKHSSTLPMLAIEPSATLIASDHARQALTEQGWGYWRCIVGPAAGAFGAMLYSSDQVKLAQPAHTSSRHHVLLAPTVADGAGPRNLLTMGLDLQLLRLWRSAIASSDSSPHPAQPHPTWLVGGSMAAMRFCALLTDVACGPPAPDGAAGSIALTAAYEPHPTASTTSSCGSLHDGYTGSDSGSGGSVAAGRTTCSLPLSAAIARGVSALRDSPSAQSDMDTRREGPQSQWNGHKGRCWSAGAACGALLGHGASRTLQLADAFTAMVYRKVCADQSHALTLCFLAAT
jgi:hypothetical protein